MLVGSAGSLGTAAGPLTGSVLSAWAGYPVMGLVLGAALLVVAVPMTAVALHTGGRPLFGDGVRRRGGALEQAVVEIPVDTPAVPEPGADDTAGPRRAGAAPGSGN